LMRHLPPTIDRVGPAHMYEVSRSAVVRWGAPDAFTPDKGVYRPRPLQRLAAQMDKAAEELRPWVYETRGKYSDGTPHEPALTVGGRTFHRHVVAPGEELSDIANIYFKALDRMDEILRANPTTIFAAHRIYAGQIINVPTG
jgi:hypothetical protein